MRSAVPKHLHPILGRRMVDWVLASARALGVDPIVVVASPATCRLRRPPGRGAGGAGAAPATPSAARAIDSATSSTMLVLSGDTPLLTSEVLRDLVDTWTRGRRRDRPLVRAGRPQAVRTRASHRRRRTRCDRRSRDATEDQRAVREVNSSIYVFRADKLWAVLDRLTPHNAQGELYLTDSVAPRRGR